MKHCPACGLCKSLSEFYREKRGGKVRYRARCRTCHNANVVRTRNPLLQREFSRAHNRSGKRDLAHQRARHAVRRAIERGALVRPDRCEECGIACAPHAHHEDYTRPLDVVWLCSDRRGTNRDTCHGRRHRLPAESLSHA